MTRVRRRVANRLKVPIIKEKSLVKRRSFPSGIGFLKKWLDKIGRQREGEESVPYLAPADSLQHVSENATAVRS